MNRLRVVLVGLVLVVGSAASADPAAQIRLLWEDGKMQVQTNRAEVDEASLFAIASVGKTMTSVAVLRLIEAGHAALADPASRHLSDDIVVGFDGLEGITLRHLFAMRSGLPDYYDADVVDMIQTAPAPLSAEQIASHVFGERPNFAPGEDFEYSNTNYLLLGLVIETITGQSYAAALQQLVFDPAGMTDSFVFGSRALPPDFVTGHEGRSHVRDYYQSTGFGDGGVIASARDVARFYDALFLESDLLSAATLRAMRFDPEGQQYGLGIVTEGAYVGHAGADLGFTSEVAAHLTDRVIAVMLVAQSGADTDWVIDQIGFD